MSGSISYTRQWTHQDWVDFVDTVQAGGNNGINVRMHGIEAEFDAISAVIKLINAALQPPTPTQQKLTLAPTLSPTTGLPWQQDTGFVSVQTVGSPTPTAFEQAASGFMPVTLPNGATVQELRVTGTSGGGVLAVTLNSQALSGGPINAIVSANASLGTVSPGVAFDIPLTSQNANVVVDNVNNKYFIVATVTNSNALLTSGGTILNAFQITYTAV